MPDPGVVIDRNEERLRRLAVGEAAQRARSRRLQRTAERIGNKVKRMAIAFAAIWAAVLLFGIFGGSIGISGFLLAMLFTVVTMVMLAIYPKPRTVDPGRMADTAPAALPAMTDVWLSGQRRDLPRLAAPAVDAISARLATLETQLAAVPPSDPVAQDISRLLGRHLPDLVDRYTRVPVEQRARTIEDSGKSLETTLIDGLKVVEAELGRASDTLAAADRDAVLYQGKFLENRYKGEEA